MTALACGHYRWSSPGGATPTLPPRWAPALGCGHARWQGKAATPTIPSHSDPDPIYVPVPAPTQPGAQGEEWHVLVAEFPSNRLRGILWDATIEDLQIGTREGGGNSITVSAPTNAATMRIFGDPTGYADQFGRPTYHVRNAISRRLIVGSTLDGLARYHFVGRGEVSLEGDRLSIEGLGIIGGLTADRVIGAPTRKNLLGDIGSFESGLSGWSLVGDKIKAGTEGGAIDGVTAVWVTGEPDGENYLEASVPVGSADAPWGRVRIGATAYVKLPATGLDIEDYALVSVVVMVGDDQVWPAKGAGDPWAGLVASDMARGSYDRTPVQGFGLLPEPPYSAVVKVRLYPVDPTQRVVFDGVQLIQPENSSTVSAVDPNRHVVKLFDHAQFGRTKSSWGVGVVTGEDTGGAKVKTWWHADGQSMEDALEEVCGADPGPEVWDMPGAYMMVMAARRRGTIRADLIIYPWDILNIAKLGVDPGAQRTAVRGQSGAGTAWAGADRGAINTGSAAGQVIDVVLSGPSGQTPNELQAWTNGQLARLSILPETTTIVVRWALGQRISVGDTIRVVQQSGAACHVGWMRVTRLAPNPRRRVWTIDLGTDPDLGG